jgi:hypothetical protein
VSTRRTAGKGTAAPRAVGAWALAALLVLAAPLAAQNPPVTPPPAAAPAGAPAAADTGQATDTARVRPAKGDSARPVPPITPGGAFLRSLILPGWGQARLQRNVTGGLFLLWEGVCATMVWKAEWQLRYARARHKFVASHTQEREDWITLLVFNHLLAGAEAYVSANLYDFPKGLTIRPLPDGRIGFGLEVPLR